MGWPGKPTHDVMDLVRKLESLCKEWGEMKHGYFRRAGVTLKSVQQEIDDVKDQIYSSVNAMDTSEADYARDMGRY
jgi:hypothetical protein